jgi:hypothetical protein
LIVPFGRSGYVLRYAYSAAKDEIVEPWAEKISSSIEKYVLETIWRLVHYGKPSDGKHEMAGLIPW